MPSVNEVRLMGHLGRDAETRFTPSGSSVTNFSLATTRNWKDKQTDEWKEQTDWHNVTAWQLSEKRTADLKRGALVYVAGRLQTRDYEKDGRKVYVTEVIADTVNYLRDANRDGGNRSATPASDRNDVGGASVDEPDVPF